MFVGAVGGARFSFSSEVRHVAVAIVSPRFPPPVSGRRTVLGRLARGTCGAKPSAAKAKAAVLVFLEGGPSHIDTFDPKPGQDTGGPFKAIDTKIAGVQFSEHFAKLAAASPTS